MARNFGTGGPKGSGNGAGVSEREDLANFISMITRDETPFMSSIGKTKANAILHEWQTDELSTPGSFAVSEGVGFNDVNNGQANAPYRSRLGNYTQINSKTVSVSGTKRAVDQAGVADEYAYQLKKRGTELRRDVEWDLIHSNNSSAQGGTVNTAAANQYPGQFVQPTNGGFAGAAGVTPRTFGGYQAFINYAGVTTGSQLFTVAGPSNVVGPNGELPNAAGVLQTSVGGTATTTWTAPAVQGAGTSGAFVGNVENPLQLTAVDTVMQNIYQNGGKATKLMLSPANRKAFSARAQAAGSTSTIAGNVRRNIDEEGSLRQSVEMYMSDFGDIMVVPNYIMGLSSSGTAAANTQDYFGLVYDPMWFNMASLRPLQEVDLGQLGDSIIGQIVEESTLEVRNPKGCGLIVGLSGT